MGYKDNGQKMIPIALSEFLNGMVAPANLYIKLASGKAILVFKEGVKFDHNRMAAYKDKNVTHLWIEEDSFRKMTDLSVDIANSGVSQSFLNASKKTFLISNAVQSVYRGFAEIGLDLSGYELAEKTTQAITDLADSDFDLQTLIAMLHEADNYIASHCVAVSVLAPAVGQEMGLESKKSLEKLALGGMFHDIGKLQIEPRLLETSITKMNSVDRKEYEMHSLYGAQMLKGLELNSEDLMTIVYQHHERNDGSGYPQKLKAHKIHPLAKVVGMCSEFLNMVMPNPRFNSMVYSPKEAIDLLGGGMGMPFDKMNHQALSDIIEKKNNNNSDSDSGNDSDSGAKDAA